MAHLLVLRILDWVVQTGLDAMGTSTPFHAPGDDIREAESALPTGPVTVMKAWIEMSHRYLAMTVGALILMQVEVAFSKVKKALYLVVWDC